MSAHRVVTAERKDSYDLRVEFKGDPAHWALDQRVRVAEQLRASVDRICLSLFNVGDKP